MSHLSLGHVALHQKDQVLAHRVHRSAPPPGAGHLTSPCKRSSTSGLQPTKAQLTSLNSDWLSTGSLWLLTLNSSLLCLPAEWPGQHSTSSPSISTLLLWSVNGGMKLPNTMRSAESLSLIASQSTCSLVMYINLKHQNLTVSILKGFFSICSGLDCCCFVHRVGRTSCQMNNRNWKQTPTQPSDM